MWKKAIVTSRKYPEMCQNKRNNPQTIWEYFVTGLQSNQEPQEYKSEILPFFFNLLDKAPFEVGSSSLEP
jgi:hypothetical protein